MSLVNSSMPDFFRQNRTQDGAVTAIITWRKNFAKYVDRLSSFASLFVCTHATGRISYPIVMKFAHNMCFAESTKPIVFGRNRIQDGGSGGHFVAKKLRCGTENPHFSTNLVQNLLIYYSMYSLLIFTVFVTFGSSVADPGAIAFGHLNYGLNTSCPAEGAL